MHSRVWGLVGFYVVLAGCSPSTQDDGVSPLPVGGFSGMTQGGASGNGGTFPGAGGATQGGFGGTSGTSPGGAAGAQGGTSGAAGSGTGNTPGTGGTPPMNVCGTLFKDCNGDPSDGCETNTGDDAQNCGDCGHVCPPGANASPTCFVGKCDFACQAHWGDCDNDPSNGCEDDLQTDQKNCGACNADCGQTACQSGGCECASDSVEGEKVPLDIYVLFDQSGSMGQDVTGGTKWDVIKGALTTFVQSPGSSGISIGIGYFPFVIPGVPAFCCADSDCGNYGPCVSGIPALFGCDHPFGNCSKADVCTGTAYIPDVPIALLPGVSGAIVNSLNAHGPGGGTPTYAALSGAYPYVKSWATAHPNDRTILVLATDGDPSGCTNNTVQSISTDLVAPALAGNPSIMTFVVGVGSSLTSLNQIAASGGTQQAFIVDTAGADPGGQFLAAMKAIEGSTLLGCQYKVPQPPAGTTFDPAKVNVQYTPNGSTATLIFHVADSNACSSSTGGWYYDNPTAPTQIILCDSTCTAINGGTSAKVEITLGCATRG